MPTWPHDRDRLVRSSVPLANAALAAGRSARPALARYKLLLADQEQRLARPVPAEGTRERRLATDNRTRYASQVEQARELAASRTERWASLMSQVIETCPDRFDDVDYAVWGEEA